LLLLRAVSSAAPSSQSLAFGHLMVWTRGAYTISTDRTRLDLAMIHAFLSTTYWAKDRPRDATVRAIAASLPFGLYHGERQLGFARVLTDYATVAYLADVFVLPEARGRGLGAWLVETAMAHPELQHVRRWLLGTRDAHGLYRKFGFGPPNSERLMELVRE